MTGEYQTVSTADVLDSCDRLRRELVLLSELLGQDGLVEEPSFDQRHLPAASAAWAAIRPLRDHFIVIQYDKRYQR